MTADLESTRMARATLGWLFEPGSPWLTGLLSEHGPQEAAAIVADGRLPHDQLRHELRQASASRLPLHKMWQTASTAVHAQRDRWRILIPEDPDWPEGLRGQGAAWFWDPVCLWARGPATAAPLRDIVAVVGARASTAYGQHTASEFAYRLADAGYTVTSSGGYGIDEAALRAALANGDKATPLALQPCGLDRVHPNANSRLIDQAAEQGLVLSAWPPTASPMRERLAANQLLLAAIAGGVVLVEASLRSSSLNTTAHALRLGRTAMAVPGPVTSATSAGCHQLLRADRRVHLVTSANEVMSNLGQPA